LVHKIVTKRDVAISILFLAVSLAICFTILSVQVAYSHSTTIAVGQTPAGIIFNTWNKEIYVTNFGSSTVSVLSGSSDSVIKTILVGYRPLGISFNPFNGNVYVANSGSNDVDVIDGLTNKIVDRILVGTSPIGIVYDPVGNDLYVMNSVSNDSSIIDASTKTVTDTIAFDNGIFRTPVLGAYNSANGGIYVTGTYGGSVSSTQDYLSLINSRTKTAAGYFQVGDDPYLCNKLPF
jgi:YVTN family beta-propeller protein